MQKSGLKNSIKMRLLAVMTAAVMMTSAVFSLTDPVTALAGTIPDNPSGSTTSVPSGETMDNNWGTITSNEGTICNNVGTVEDNYGTVENNWGTVDNDLSDSGVPGNVEVNHTGGTVTDGHVTNNYGDYSISTDNQPLLINSVTNNYKDGTVVGSADVDGGIDVNYGTATDVNSVGENYGTVINNNIIWGSVASPGTLIGNNYEGATRGGTGDFTILNDDVPVPASETENLTKEDPNPTAPVDPSISADPDPNPNPNPDPGPQTVPISEPQVRISGIAPVVPMLIAQIPTELSVATFTIRAKKVEKGEDTQVTGWEFTVQQSPLAYQSLIYAAQSLDGTVLQTMQLKIVKITNGKFEIDSSYHSTVQIKIPSKADLAKKHTLARAANGGDTQILENLSEDPNTIECDIPLGESAYAVIEY